MGARWRTQVVKLPMLEALPQTCLSFWADLRAYSRRFLVNATYNQKASPRKRRTSYSSSLGQAFLRVPNYRAPLTSQGCGRPYGRLNLKR